MRAEVLLNLPREVIFISILAYIPFPPQNTVKSQEVSAEEEARTAENILNSPSLAANLCIMERVVTRNIYQGKQALYRSMRILPDPDSGDSKVWVIILLSFNWFIEYLSVETVVWRFLGIWYGYMVINQLTVVVVL